MVCRGEVIKLIKVMGDDNKLRDVITAYHYKMLKIKKIKK